MEQKKIALLKDVLGGYCIHIGNEYLFHCPNCDTRNKFKLSVNLQKNVYKCWVCDCRGNSVSNLVKKYGNAQQFSYWSKLVGEINLAEKEDIKSLLYPSCKKEEEIKIKLPKEFISLVGNLDTSALQARNYLSERKITERDIRDWRIGFAFEGEYENRIIVPSFDIEGKINYFVSRTYEDDYVKYKNPVASKNIIFNELFVDFRNPIILTEGVFDAIVAGENSIPIMGSTLSESSKLFQEIVTNNTVCYLGLDPDAEKKEMNIIKKLLLYDIEIYKIMIIPYKDIGEMTKEEFKKRKEDAVRIDNERFALYQMLRA